ncbi:MAG: hypothetical protein HYS17_07600 [Micavibrio aeruginosavorus]|uniref:Uncharacterized protein n=1 Tax=Micavibrio aeruginosavorus TaxID=349221 RepID=A0A7T5R0S2_9BACT|nr:MAG: hypothetical protein HYS17_07600 [Micavibrio aeruginosavorus]
MSFDKFEIGEIFKDSDEDCRPAGVGNILPVEQQLRGKGYLDLLYLEDELLLEREISYDMRGRAWNYGSVVIAIASLLLFLLINAPIGAYLHDHIPAEAGIVYIPVLIITFLISSAISVMLWKHIGVIPRVLLRGCLYYWPVTMAAIMDIALLMAQNSR